MPQISRAKIKNAVLQTLKQANIHALPIDLTQLFDCFGWTALTYERADRADIAIDTSCDGVTIKIGTNYIIYYNDTLLPHRIRWTLAHEAGHIILGAEATEADAHYFAEQLLMPLAHLVALGAQSENDIMRICNVSQEAAHNRMVDIERHHDYFSRNGYTAHDLAFLRQFEIKQ